MRGWTLWSRVGCLLLSCFLGIGQALGVPLGQPPSTGSRPTPPPLSPQMKHLADLYNQAGRLHQEGKLDEALATYRQFLQLARALHQPPQAQFLALAQIYNIYAERKDLKGIEETLLQIVKLIPTDSEAWARLARIAAAERDWAKAQQLALHALRLKPPAPIAALAHEALGMAALGRKDYKAARQQLHTALQLAPNDVDARYNYAFALYASGNLREAETQAKLVCEKQPKNLSALFLLASIRQTGRDLKDAIATYEQILAIDPRNHDALFNRALLAQQIGMVQEAEKAYTALLKLYPDDAPARFNFGLLYAGLKNYPAARNQFLLAAPVLEKEKPKSDPLLTKLLANLAQVEAQMVFDTANAAQRQELIAQAERHYKEAIALDPNNLRLQYQLAVLYRNVGRYQDALAIYKKRYAQNPADSSAAFGIADVAFMQGKPDDALAIWRDFVQHNPKDPVGHIQYAQVLELRGRWQEAAEQRAQLVALNPEDGSDLLAQAHDLLQANQLPAAQAIYNKVLTLKPQSQSASNMPVVATAANVASWRLSALQGLADIAQKQNKLDDALRYLQQAAEEDRANAEHNHTTPHAEPYLEMASIYEKENQPDKAIQTLNQLAALLPLDEKPYVELGHLYEREGKVEQAVDALIKASQRAKDPLPDSLEAADVYRSHKMYDKAVALYRSLQKRFPNSVELLSNLAQTLEQSGQDEQALAVYQQLYKANPTLVWVLDKEATVLTRLKRYPEAVALREQQIAAAPNNPQAYADLIHLYALEGKPEACLAWLQTKAQQQPDNASLLSALLDQYDALKRHQEGIAYLQELVGTHPKNAVALACIQALQSHGLKKEALDMMGQVAQKAPTDVSLQESYAAMLSDSGDKKAAIAVYQKLLQQPSLPTSDRLQVRQLLAQQLQSMGDLAGAQEQYEQILKESPNDTQSLLNLITLWKGQGKLDQIIAFCTNFVTQPGLSQMQRAWTYTYLGQAFQQQKNIAEARAQYQAALRCMPQFPPAETALANLPPK
ncbi:MAG TPA: tetratricopeptide repeat protein [Chthonomonas sp.]|uniref:tetratricopeptide repeat protein n=1 Tax=Chthonomonas sp. TaxID=2282153 RepID=UPI002B4B0CC4|nr:tetratricopeptide repeat protein [Chthonomonas sp.]HLI48455.1 tetratricopeptide repeat protein [Chthonomonas sp.]